MTTSIIAANTAKRIPVVMLLAHFSAVFFFDWLIFFYLLSSIFRACIFFFAERFCFFFFFLSFFSVEFLLFSDFSCPSSFETESLCFLLFSFFSASFAFVSLVCSSQFTVIFLLHTSVRSASSLYSGRCNILNLYTPLSAF